jgi:hypothetical protein
MMKMESCICQSPNFLYNSLAPKVSITIITLANEIVINNAGALTIIGNGANVLTFDGGPGTNRIFYIAQVVVTISGVTLTGGNGQGAIAGGFGTAILVSGGTLVLESVVVRANVGTGSRGAVWFTNIGMNHRIDNSTFSDNRDTDCAGFRINSGTLTVTNSTISGNQANDNAGNALVGSGVGGGFCVIGGTLTMRNSTVTENSSNGVNGGGGGIYVTTGTLNLGNTIVAGNITSNGLSPEIRRENSGTITSAGYNLVGDSAGDSTNTNFAITYQPTDILDVNPLLGALQNNGGQTPTHALLIGSPAINAGNNAEAPVTDQRGFARIIGGTIDIGAFEYAPVKSRKRVRFF